MSYNIGQWRKNQLDSYMSHIPLYSTTGKDVYVTNEYPSPYFEHDTYNELEITLPKDNQDNLQYFQEDENYYFKFTVLDPVEFKVKLIGDNNKSMFIKSFKTFGNSTKCELVFTPNDKIYNAILFEKVRTDVYDKDPVALVKDSANGEYTEIQLKKLVNIMNILKNQYSNLSYLKQLGIQGPSGFMFSMNGEEFYVGKSGIYEVDGINITSLSFVVDGQKIQEDDRKNLEH